MTTVSVHAIPYCTDSKDYFLRIKNLPNPVWLDSGCEQGRLGRYDILAAEPSVLLNTRVSGSTCQTSIRTDGGITHSDANPFDLLDYYLAELPSCQEHGLPFTGGAIGYFGYNLKQCVEPLLTGIRKDVDIPDMLVGIYDWAIVQDHKLGLAHLVANSRSDSAKVAELKKWLKDPENGLLEGNLLLKINQLESNLKVSEYCQSIAKIQQYILQGDCYQVNFAQRFSARYQGDPLAAQLLLRQLLPAPHAAYMAFEGGAILSHSPERFLKIEGNLVETRPIKGTMPRSKNPEQDRRNARQLSQSQKDRAENLMIVDLMRNDLSKSCDLGSVTAPALFEIESYANVHHLVSQVSGHLRPDCSPVQLLKGCFPGGSITGAPKFRAMEIIDELENTDRSVYCGSIGYISSNGRMDSSITIRTVMCDSEKVFCWGGGGIVADSTPEGEYQESLDKIQVLLDGLAQFYSDIDAD